MKYLLIVLTIIAFLLMLFYLFIAFIGKMISNKTKTSDRFIWTSLKLVETNDENADFKSATLFLDKNNLYITKYNIFQINNLLNNNNYQEFIRVPLNSISKFEYSNVHQNTGAKFFVAIFNKLFIRNSFVLQIEYLNSFGKKLYYDLKSGNLRSEDFEAIFIDIDHQIYKSRVALMQKQNDETKLSEKEKKQKKPVVKKNDETRLNVIKEDVTKSKNNVNNDETVLITKKQKNNDVKDSVNTNKLN